jgi:hypothetical protein
LFVKGDRLVVCIQEWFGIVRLSAYMFPWGFRMIASSTPIALILLSAT